MKGGGGLLHLLLHLNLLNFSVNIDINDENLEKWTQEMPFYDTFLHIKCELTILSENVNMCVITVERYE